uniref:Transposase domain-containing protein n=1 Tax=Anopheles minimus TaxID=112268 RepID=A0A182VVM0_9DIPT
KFINLSFCKYNKDVLKLAKILLKVINLIILLNYQLEAVLIVTHKSIMIFKNGPIKQNAVKGLISVLDKRLPNVFPKDPRTFLKNDRVVQIVTMGEGQYWHNGFRECLKQAYPAIHQFNSISIKINIDGLPVYNSSRDEFWPILFNIEEAADLQPMIIGIYSGKGKPSDINLFLNPFVDEMEDVLKHGVMINGHIISVSIRCFICDSPARAFIKGVANFNNQHGCQKCTTVGEYSYLSHCNYFPRMYCIKRTDEGFRSKIYGSHHMRDSPILRLPVNMISDFPVGDALHLIDLGIMKKCLSGWRDGKFGNYRTKWSASEVAEISNLLLQLKMPAEIHRAVRGLDCLSHWKALEFRTFLLYISIVILKPFLSCEVYEHFLLLFCAVTICTSKEYTHFLDLAHSLLLHYIECYGDIYGEDFITSNVHNLSHLVDDVKSFGILPNFSAYPFESKLFQIKHLIRSGHLPLTQIAKRINEINKFADQNISTRSSKLKLQKPIFENNVVGSESNRNNETRYACIKFEEFCLKNDGANKWFLTRNNEIVEFKYVLHSNSMILLNGE